MKKLKRKDKKVKEEKAAESTRESNFLMLRDEIEKWARMINENKQRIDCLFTEYKKSDPVVTATPIVSDKKPSVSRYDDVCKEIDERIK